MAAAILKLPPLSEVAEIMARAHDAGVDLRVEDGHIVARPRAAVTEELRHLIRSNKEAIIAVLATEVADVAHVADAHGDQDKVDLAEVDALIRQLAQLERWSAEELAEALDGRQRMAPARVPEVLRQLRVFVAAGPLANGARRPKIVFCRLTVVPGGKR